MTKHSGWLFVYLTFFKVPFIVYSNQIFLWIMMSVKNWRLFLQAMRFKQSLSTINLSNENLITGVSVVFKAKHELKCQNKLFFWKHQFFCFRYWEFTENFWRNNCRSIFDDVERLYYIIASISTHFWRCLIMRLDAMIFALDNKK